jgi:hypothetical protein
VNKIKKERTTPLRLSGACFCLPARFIYVFLFVLPLHLLVLLFPCSPDDFTEHEATSVRFMTYATKGFPAPEKVFEQIGVAQHRPIRFLLFFHEPFIGWPLVWNDRVRASSGNSNISKIVHDYSMIFCL